MNLNECVLKKPRSNFIAPQKCNDPEIIENSRGNQRLFNFEEAETPKSTKKNSTLFWGSACASVATSSSRRTSNKSSDEINSRTIIALTEGRGQARCEVGIAAIKISSPVLIICQISDSPSYINTLTKINIFNPTEILFPHTFENDSGNRLMIKLKKQFPKIKFIKVSRTTFNKNLGMNMLSKLCVPSLNGIILVLEHRYYALAATSALLTHIQENLFIYYAVGSLNIDYQESEGYALIDVATADRLELVCSTKPAQANKYSSLFGILNNCQTKVGTRTLRSWILQPLHEVQFIRARLDCVDELMNNRDVLAQLHLFLQKLSNIDSLLNLTSVAQEDPQKCSNRQLNYILSLNSIIGLVTPLRDLISNLKQPFFENIKKTLNDQAFVIIKDKVRKTLNEDAYLGKGVVGNEQRCYCIKPGVNPLLDVVRKVYCERIQDLKEHVNILGTKYNYPLTLGNNQKKGYHIILNTNNQKTKHVKKSDLPREFLEVRVCGTHLTMKTVDLINISTRLDDILDDITKISNTIVYNIILDFKEYIPLFYKLCEEIAQLDVYQSLAQTSLENHYVRPEFGEYTNVEDGLHPMLNFLLPSKPTGNSIFCSDDYNVHIITGPNGSGKSIYIRQVMLLQIMAQIGCFVPAKSAVFKPVKKMFARIYLDDNMEYNASSYVLEMKEIKYIMSTMSEDSLILIDELGRSTCIEEGVSIAIAILEVMSTFRSFIFVTTHFTMLKMFARMYPHIKTWQMETVADGNDPKTLKLIYKYNLIPGINQISRYGVYIVRNIWPKTIIKNVDDSIDRIEKEPQHAIFTPLNQKSVLKYEVESNLRHIKRQGMLNIININKILFKYKEDLKSLNWEVTDIIPVQNSFNTFTNRDEEYLKEQEMILENILTPVYSSSNHNEQNSTQDSFASVQIDVGTPLQFNTPSLHKNEAPKHCMYPSVNVKEGAVYSSSNYNSQNSIQDSFACMQIDVGAPIKFNKPLSHKNEAPKHCMYPSVNVIEGQVYSSSSSNHNEHNSTQDSFACVQIDVRTPIKFNKPPSHKNETSKHCLYPLVNVIEGPNNTTMSSQNSFSTVDSPVRNNNFVYPEKNMIQYEANSNLDRSIHSLQQAQLMFNNKRTNNSLLNNSRYSLSNKQEMSLTDNNSEYDEGVQNLSNISNKGKLNKSWTSKHNNNPFNFSKPITNVNTSLSSISKERNFDFVPKTNRNFSNSLSSPISQNFGYVKNISNGFCQNLDTNRSENHDIEVETRQHFNVSLSSASQRRNLDSVDDTSSSNKDEGENNGYVFHSSIKDRQCLNHSCNISKERNFVLENDKIDKGEDIFNSSTKRQNINDIIATQESTDNDISKNDGRIFNSFLKKQQNLNSSFSSISKKRNIDFVGDKSSLSKDEMKQNPQIFNSFIEHNSLSCESENEFLEPANRNSLSNRDETKSDNLSREQLQNLEGSLTNASKKRNIGSAIDKLSSSKDGTRNSEQTLNESRLFSLSKNRNLESTFDQILSSKEQHQHLNEGSLSNTSKKGNLEFADDKSSSSKEYHPLNDSTLCNDSKKKNLESSFDKTSASKEEPLNLNDSSLSNASKKRNLESPFDKTSTSKEQHQNLNDTSISSASKKRNIELTDDKTSTRKEQLSNLNNSSLSNASKQRNLDSPFDKSSNTKEQLPNLNNSSLSNASKQRNLDSFDKSSTMKEQPPNLNDSSLSNASKQRNLESPYDKSSTTKEQPPNLNDSSLSSASKKRNLESPFDKSSTSKEEHQNLIDTSISSASKKRNLESADDKSSTSKDENLLNSTRSHHNDSLSHEQVGNCAQLLSSTSLTNASDKFNLESSDKSFSNSNKDVSLKSNEAPQHTSSSSTKSAPEVNKGVKKRVSKFKKFVPPRRLTAKQIKKEFEEQDRELASTSNIDIEEYVKHKMNRPSVEQIQNATYLGTLKQTPRGLEMVEAPTSSAKRRKTIPKMFSSESIDMTIFSDKNAMSFEKFIGSKETDYRNFHFESSKKMFSFKEEKENIFEYFTACSGNVSQNFSQNFSLTPDGYYKEHRDEINKVLSKYLPDFSPSPSSEVEPNFYKNNDNHFNNLS